MRFLQMISNTNDKKQTNKKVYKKDDNFIKAASLQKFSEPLRAYLKCWLAKRRLEAYACAPIIHRWQMLQLVNLNSGNQ